MLQKGYAFGETALIAQQPGKARSGT
jgi:hypothetical protein